MFEHRGNQVVCPICGASFAHFGKYGTKNRTNARCYKCESLERHRLLWLYFNNQTDFFERKNLKLLHVAPELCLYAKFSKMPSVNYYPCDLFPELYPYKEVFKMDLTNIHFEENFFDVIICNHVLEHIPDDAKAMAQLYRVMKKGGWGIFQVPIDYKREKTYEDFSITTPQERFKAFGQKDHVRWYGQDYKDRLSEANFIVKEDDWVKHFSDEEIQRYRLSPKELIYYCQKENGY